ncbi:hypothetical protein HMJ29_02330 [Hymenobacter taeanensis]|uniref:PorT family protein n=1 Tax=Hymenobacter taeanensis TaxID=2735321 RepID=A0A6M6BDL7_9BACT|nr:MULTISPECIES: hypothetical protein [Hymenobacter]QJX45834.1 hypothetical protein HMJ29_02330 [Hymenobacter taeanensis]UOQ79677.1 hypothetical protein MUN83_12535 [Hymenobacter sp. 5414T-23]
MHKTSILLSCALLSGLATMQSATAQHLQAVGVAGSFNINQTWAKQRELTLGSTTILTYTDNARQDDTGNRISAYARVGIGQGTFFVQPEVGYTKVLGNQYEVQFPRGTFYYAPWIRRLEVGALAGYHVTEKFYVVAGPVVARHEREKAISSSTESWVAAYNSLYASPERVQLLGQVGIGVQLWRFDVGARYEGSLTPYTRQLRFDNKLYAFRQNTTQYIVQVGFLLFDHNRSWTK